MTRFNALATLLAAIPNHPPWATVKGNKAAQKAIVIPNHLLLVRTLYLKIVIFVKRFSHFY
jgi:hypothetical protein